MDKIWPQLGQNAIKGVAGLIIAKVANCGCSGCKQDASIFALLFRPDKECTTRAHGLNKKPRRIVP